MTQDSFRILASPQAAGRAKAALTRRGFLGLSAAGAAAAFLAACGGDDGGSGTASGGDGGGEGGGSGATSFNLYTWAEYNDPDLMQSFGDITIDIFNSVDEAIQKLQVAQGTSGYDVVVPTGPYIPAMAAAGLLEEMDLTRLKNFGNLDPAYVNQTFDPGNKYSICKNWGSTGWFYDKSVVKTEIKTWNDFIKVAQTEASGRTSVLDIPPDLVGIYFWSNGIDWTTEDPAQLDACEKFLVEEFAPHLKAFDSYPGIRVTQGELALAQVFNGDARQGLIQVEDAGGDSSQFVWGLGAPATELWMDNWCIVKGAKNVDAAYNFLDFILTPENSVKDLAYHGFHTGLKGIETLVPSDLKHPEIIFFTPEQVATMQAGEVNSAQSRLVEILNNVKAKAGA